MSIYGNLILEKNNIINNFTKEIKRTPEKIKDIEAAQTRACFMKVKIGAYYDYYGYMEEYYDNLEKFMKIFKQKCQQIKSKKNDIKAVVKLCKEIPKIKDVYKDIEKKQVLPPNSSLYDLLEKVDKSILNKNLFQNNLQSIKNKIEQKLKEYVSLAQKLNNDLDNIGFKFKSKYKEEALYLFDYTEYLEGTYYDSEIGDNIYATPTTPPFHLFIAKNKQILDKYNEIKNSSFRKRNIDLTTSIDSKLYRI